jgi:hypothetical protein
MPEPAEEESLELYDSKNLQRKVGGLYLYMCYYSHLFLVTIIGQATMETLWSLGIKTHLPTRLN